MKFPDQIEDLNSITQFKTDIVNAISEIEEKATNRMNQIQSTLNSKFSIYQSKIEDIDKTLKEISSKVINLQITNDSFHNILPNQKKFSESLMTYDIRLSNLSKELSNANFKYDKIILDNLIIPGQVGEYCKFKNMKDFILFLSDQIAILNAFKEKTIYDMKNYKEKLDKNYNFLNNKIEASQNASEKLISTRLSIVEKDYKDTIQDYLTQVSEIKIENSKCYALMKDSSNQLKTEIDTMRSLKNEIIAMNDQLIKETKRETESMNDKFLSIKNEFNKINKHFVDLVEFIKDVRFKKNINTDVTKNDLKNLISNLENNNIIDLNESKKNNEMGNSLTSLSKNDSASHGSSKNEPTYDAKSKSRREISKAPTLTGFNKTKKLPNLFGNSPSINRIRSSKPNSSTHKPSHLPSLDLKLSKTDSYTKIYEIPAANQDVTKTCVNISPIKKKKIPKTKKKSKIKVKNVTPSVNNNERAVESGGIFCNVTILDNLNIHTPNVKINSESVE